MPDSLALLRHVWAQQPPGFVFISLRRGPEQWEDLSFKFPADELELPNSKAGDIYFCPNVFSRPRRRQELVLPSCWLYADLDQAEPIRNDAELSPTVAWESSPGRYQALWHIDQHLPAEAHSRVNRQLSYTLGADKGGWDLTQVLRVPGTVNHKYAEKPEVKLLWQSA